MSRWCLAAAALLLSPAAPVDAQRAIEQSGAYVHRATEAVFAERVGDFRRSDLYQYDEAGDDVSATYNLMRPEGRLVLTVYVFPAPAPPSAGSPGERAAAKASLCGAMFEGAREVIAGQHAGARATEVGGATPAAGVAPALSRRSVYAFRMRFNGAEQEVRSEVDLYCYVRGDWMVKYRVTSAMAVPAAAPIAEFIRTGPWPGRKPREAPADPAVTASR